jgi:hypothetical protein
MPPFRWPVTRPIDWQHDPDYRAARALARKALAPILFIFGLVLINPYADAFATSRAWLPMSSISNGYEWPWGVLFMCIGIAHFIAFTKHKGEIYTCATVLGAYAFITLLFLPYGYTSTEPYIYGTLTVAAYYELKYIFSVFVRLQ